MQIMFDGYVLQNMYELLLLDKTSKDAIKLSISVDFGASYKIAYLF